MNRDKIILGLMIISLIVMFGLATIVIYQEPDKGENSSDNTSSSVKQTIAIYSDITPEEANEMITKDPLVIIDVSDNYQNGHLPRSVNYPIDANILENKIPLLDRTDTYLIYSDSDSTSTRAAQMLIDADFDYVYRLSGNFSSWQADGFDIEK